MTKDGSFSKTYEFYEKEIKQEIRNRQEDYYFIARVNSVKELSKKDAENKNIDINLLALGYLEEIGFNHNFSTLMLADLIEDIYHERSIIDDSPYFDLTSPHNLHFKNLSDRYMMGSEELFKSLVFDGIVKSDCEIKNINDIISGAVYDINKKVEKKKINSLRIDNVNK